MASLQINENPMQLATCRCGEGENNIWTARGNESSENQTISCPNCEILKSGPLFISYKGIGWTSWKKRWFVLSRKSLMFYRVDPNALPQKGSEVSNPTLGGIELNNSGSVVVKAEKKLLTVLFSDGQDGRAFTLKTETLDELNDWKTTLEGALARAPCATNVLGKSGIFCNETVDSFEASAEQCKDKPGNTSSVVGRPALLALEDIDGSPSFLEKALRFIEEYGVRVEGILRHSAVADQVVRRVKEYEQGKSEFTPDEDAHVIGDCIKHVLREMPSSPVPASCCAALVNAYRTDRGSRVDNIRDTIYETFPEPNCRLLKRVLQMMLTVGAHKADNRMSLSALAACMAPLLLRPLLAGECELNNDFQMDGDGCFQLLQAAAAANHAQAILIILLEEYEKIFDDGSFSSELYTDSEEEDIEDDESTENDIPEEYGYPDAKNDLQKYAEGDADNSCSATPSQSDSDVGSDMAGDIGSDLASDVGSNVGNDVGSNTNRYAHSDTGGNAESDAGSSFRSASCNGGIVRSDAGIDVGSNMTSDQEIKGSTAPLLSARNTEVVENCMINSNKISASPHEDIDLKTSRVQFPADALSFNHTDAHKDSDFPSEKSNSIVPLQEKSKAVQPTMRNKWGRSSARKNLSKESLEYISDDESAVQRLENAKIDLQTKISEEIKVNAILQSNLVGGKKFFRDRRLTLEKDVVRLQEQLQKERDLRSHIESCLMETQHYPLSTIGSLDNNILADLEENVVSVRDIKNSKTNITDATKHLQQGQTTFCQSCGQPIYTSNQQQENVNNIQTEHVEDKLLNHDNTYFKVDQVDSNNKQTRGSPSSKKKRRPFLERYQCWSNHDSRISLGLAGVLLKEDTTISPEPAEENGGAIMEKLSSSAKNPRTNSCSENLRVEVKNTTYLEEGRTHQRLLPKISNSSAAKYSEASSSEDRRGTIKKIERWENSKRDASESLSSWKLTSSQKKQPSAHTLKNEEGYASSLTVTKITNRLNFLKERRVQLANEVQNLDSNRAMSLKP